MKNKKGFTPIAIVLIVIAVLALGGTAYYTGKSSSSVSQNVQGNDVTNNKNVNSDISSITVLSPNGGETLQSGSTYKINWESLNLPSTAKIYVSLVRGFKGDIDYNELSKNIVSGLSSTTNNYLWKVDTSDLGLGSDYTIVVVATWGSFDSGTFARTYDLSNASFGIAISTTTNNIPNWKTYKNDKYTYELKYPENWQFGGEVDIPPSPYFTYRWDDKSYCRFNVVVSNSKSDNEILNFKNKGYSEEKIIVGGASAIKLSKSPTGTNNESQDLVYFGKGLNYYRITRFSFKDENERKCMDIFSQILETFKFN